MPIRHRTLPLAALLTAFAATAPGAPAAEVAPTHVLVRFHAFATHADRVRVVERTGTGDSEPVAGGVRELRIEDGDSVATTLAELRAQPGVASARPDYVVHKAGAPTFRPNDPGRGGPCDWSKLQWNFAGRYGVHAPRAWATMRSLHKDGGRGVVVAVVDSGVAYRDRGNFRRAPDLYRGRFVKGWDFVEHDRYPLDLDSHGTHVSGTIAEHVNNKQAVTGLAYGVRIMPVRVLDENGDGDGATFARAIRWAAKHGADVINMSVEFDSTLHASDIPDVIDALDYAHRKGAVMVGSAGNDGQDQLAYPARYSQVIAVGATSSNGCRTSYTSFGSGLDVVAPGGGGDDTPDGSDWDLTHCHPGEGGRVIYQQTFKQHHPRDFHLFGFEGTSESAPHVTAIAALVLASGRLGPHPAPEAVQNRIEDTARDIGAPGRDDHYGYGLADAAAAVSGG
jgi:serine protease